MLATNQSDHSHYMNNIGGPVSENKERTLAILSCSDQLKDMIDYIERQGFTIILSKQFQFTMEQAEEFYKHYKKQSYYEKQMNWLSSTKVCALILEKENAVMDWKKLMGPMNYKKAKKTSKESIRAIFGKDTTQNATHGSDMGDYVSQEIDYIFHVLPSKADSSLQPLEVVDEQETHKKPHDDDIQAGPVVVENESPALSPHEEMKQDVETSVPPLKVTEQHSQMDNSMPPFKATEQENQEGQVNVETPPFKATEQDHQVEAVVSVSPVTTEENQEHHAVYSVQDETPHVAKEEEEEEIENITPPQQEQQAILTTTTPISNEHKEEEEEEEETIGDTHSKETKPEELHESMSTTISGVPEEPTESVSTISGDTVHTSTITVSTVSDSFTAETKSRPTSIRKSDATVEPSRSRIRPPSIIRDKKGMLKVDNQQIPKPKVNGGTTRIARLSQPLNETKPVVKKTTKVSKHLPRVATLTMKPKVEEQVVVEKKKRLSSTKSFISRLTTPTVASENKKAIFNSKSKVST